MTSTNTDTETPDNLFDVIPFRDQDLSDDTKRTPYCCILYMPGPVFHQIKRTLKRYGINTCSTSGRKLGSVLCAKYRKRPPPTHSKGVKRTCCGKAFYVGQTMINLPKMPRTQKSSEKRQLGSLRSFCPQGTLQRTGRLGKSHPFGHLQWEKQKMFGLLCQSPRGTQNKEA